MLKKISYILIVILALTILSGCSAEEENYWPRVRILESTETFEFDLPNYTYFYIGAGDFPFEEHYLRVLNGWTAEIEKTLEFNRYQWVLSQQTVGDYHVIQVNDVNLPSSFEFLILDKSFNIIESFTIYQAEDGVLFSMLFNTGWFGERPIVKNETGEWLVYLVSHNTALGFSRFYTYNLNNRELTPIFEIDIPALGTMGSDLHLISGTNQLAFTIFYSDWVEERIVNDIEYWILDLETFEAELVFQTDGFNEPGVTVIGEYLVISNRLGGDLTEVEVIFIHSLTRDMHVISLEGYQWINPISTEDSQLLFTANFNWDWPGLTVQVRLYDIETAEVIFEYEFIDENTLTSDETLWQVEFLNIEKDIYMIRARIVREPAGANMMPAGSRLEQIFIEIRETDDE